MTNVIPKSELKDHSYYRGYCRNARVAIWDAKNQLFYYMVWAPVALNGKYVAEAVPHMEDRQGHLDFFQPEEEIKT
jgi:hypothetical protein